MARNTTPAPESREVPANEVVIAEEFNAANQLAVMTIEANDQAVAIAKQIGYSGAVTVGALEDEIRFYQRRTVEAILECGKRLRLLKKMTAHGEFEQRVGMLGFSDRTARRFMQAAQKVSKSANLAVLSTQVKSASAFLELVTHDDDALESLKDMDDIDRMSASELRDTLRQAKQDHKYATEQQTKERDRAEKAEKALKADGPKAPPPLSVRLEEISEDIDKVQKAAADALLQISGQIKSIDQWWMDEMVKTPGFEPGDAVPMPTELVALAQKLHDNAERIAAAVGSLQHMVFDRFGHEIQAARTYVMQPGVIPGHAGQAEVE